MFPRLPMTRPVQLIAVPYDSGKMGERFGRGPLRALDLHAAGAFPHAELPPRVVTHGGGFATEGSAAFLIAARISDLVRAARQAGAFPLIVAGNCMTSLGTVSGLDGERAVLWLDAHPDYNTPDTTMSGFLDGMGTAALVGDAWRAAAASVPGYRPVAKSRLLFLGIRDIDPPEAERIARDGVAAVAPDNLRTNLSQALAAVAAIGAGADSGYLHFDMDVLDPDPVPANEFAAPGGVPLASALEFLSGLAGCFPLSAAAVTAYDPGLDRGGVMLDAYRQVITRLAELGAAT
jgi:arginase